jgi:hypothetical protein
LIECPDEQDQPVITRDRGIPPEENDRDLLNSRHKRISAVTLNRSPAFQLLQSL